MQKFLVLYMAPIASLDEWMKQDEAVRKADEDKMKMEWDDWMTEHKSMFSGVTAGVGKTKRVTKEGVTDTRNDIMLCSVIEASSQDEAAAAFVGHPHYGIPGAWIDIMPMNVLPGMAGN